MIGTILEYLGWRESPGSTRLFASRRAAVAVVLIITITAIVFRVL